MAKSQQTFNKKEREKKKQKRRKEKMERRQERKALRDAAPKKTFEDQLSYVDENGNLSNTPPDPLKKKKVVLAENIVLGVPKRIDEPVEIERTGKVKFFNEEKGYGFIIDAANQDSIFVHANNLSGPIQDNDKVSFEIEMGMKGPTAVKVKVI